MYFNDLKLGMSVEIAPAVIEKQKMMDFARTYDPIPLHTDEAYAKGTMFGQLIAPGVMSFMSVWAKYLEQDFFGKELIAGKSTKIEWHKPVYAEDVLCGKAVIKGKSAYGCAGYKDGCTFRLSFLDEQGALLSDDLAFARIMAMHQEKKNPKTL